VPPFNDYSAKLGKFAIVLAP